MNADYGKMIIRQAAEEDAWQIAGILVEDWKMAYRGIMGAVKQWIMYLNRWRKI